MARAAAAAELLARAIHRASARAAKPFVAINCGAIPEALLESELFGHEKGPLPVPRPGTAVFQAAEGGTLFLDEIGDMPLPLQVKCCACCRSGRCARSAQRRRSRSTYASSATHRDLDAAMRDGTFREDLFYRLNVVSLTLPSLDARREDIPLLATHFLKLLVSKYRKQVNGFAPDALEALATSAWPGMSASSTTWSNRSVRWPLRR